MRSTNRAPYCGEPDEVAPLASVNWPGVLFRSRKASLPLVVKPNGISGSSVEYWKAVPSAVMRPRKPKIFGEATAQAVFGSVGETATAITQTLARSGKGAVQVWPPFLVSVAVPQAWPGPVTAQTARSLEGATVMRAMAPAGDCVPVLQWAPASAVRYSVPPMAA